MLTQTPPWGLWLWTCPLRSHSHPSDCVWLWSLHQGDIKCMCVCAQGGLPPKSSSSASLKPTPVKTHPPRVNKTMWLQYQANVTVGTALQWTWVKLLLFHKEETPTNLIPGTQDEQKPPHLGTENASCWGSKFSCTNRNTGLASIAFCYKSMAQTFQHNSTTWWTKRAINSLCPSKVSSIFTLKANTSEKKGPLSNTTASAPAITA